MRVAIEVALYEVKLRREVAKPVVGFAVGEVAKAEDLTDLARCEEFLELFAVFVSLSYC